MRGEYAHLFGPVPSRRLGRSLGVDLTPYKTCTLDCVFCQLGRTTNKTMEGREYVPAEDVKAELARWLAGGRKADFITLSGSGEPTLHTGAGDILRFLRERTDIPTALLSNGSLFWRQGVREAAKWAHIVKVSLSAWDQPSFNRVNRPHPGLELRRIVDGYRALRDAFHGRLWIEVFLVPGMNSRPEDVRGIAELVKSVDPDEVQLNTAVRPPAEESVFAMPREEMESLARLFRPPAVVVADFAAQSFAGLSVNVDAILAMLQRRPCTVAQISTAFGMHVNEVSKYLGMLLNTGQIRARTAGRETYYAACDASRQ